MKSPYEITNQIMASIASISEKIGEAKAAHLNKPPTDLRKKNLIKTIHSSLAIEGNTLTLKQITDLQNNKRVPAPRKDILEAKNAITVYNNLDRFKVFELPSLYHAHELLMKDLIDQPGKLRNSSEGILKGDETTHVVPPPKMVPSLLEKLFAYLKNDQDLILIKSCVFQYEFEFIHPFLDGNGRMARLWQTLILQESSPVFEFLPIETIIKERHKDYYRVLERSDSQGNSTAFIEFMLRVIDDALEDLLKIQNISLSNIDRIENFKAIIGNKYFSRQEYLRTYKEISTATASRDLKIAVEAGIITRYGDKRTTKYRFVEFV